MQIITKYFPDLLEKQIIQFSELKNLYNFWNSRINVISRKDIIFLYERHVLHSLAIAKLINFVAGTTVLDIGTGGGFPGIPLAILFPECDFLLMDSIGKKIKVVNAIVNELKLTNVKTEQNRAENLKQKFDFVVSRGVTSFLDFANLVCKNIHSNNKNALPNGILYLKGGDFSEEVQNFKNKILIYNISDFFEESFFKTKKIVYFAV